MRERLHISAARHLFARYERWKTQHLCTVGAPNLSEMSVDALDDALEGQASAIDSRFTGCDQEAVAERPFKQGANAVPTIGQRGISHPCTRGAWQRSRP